MVTMLYICINAYNLIMPHCLFVFPWKILLYIADLPTRLSAFNKLNRICIYIFYIAYTN